MNNIIFYFSGTGNCLDLAKKIANEVGNCDILSMGNTKKLDIDKQYENVGFIYPTYFAGIPNIVYHFINDFHLNNDKNTYYFAINTCGGNTGNGLTQFKEEFEKQNRKLNFGITVKMPGNYIVMYGRLKNTEEILKDTYKNIERFISSIKKKENNDIGKTKNLLKFLWKSMIKKVNVKDKNFNINNDCIGCGICSEVCPVKNIEIKNEKPEYQHKCEQCMACIQYCPQKAINYKNITKARIRYINPNINYKELVEKNINY